MNFPSPTSRSWFSPPVHMSEELTRRAFALWNTAWGTFGVGTAFLVIMIAMEPESTARRMGTILGLATIAVVAHEASRRGHTTAASWTFLALIIAFLTQRAWITGGIHAPILPLYVIAIMMGGVLLGGRGAWAAAGAAVAGSGLLVAGELAGWIEPPRAFASPIAMFLFGAMILGLSVLIQRLVTKSFRLSLSRSEELVATRTAELRASLEKLQGLEGTRDDLVRMIVHDMRSQLLVVLANLELARTSVHGEVAEEVDDAMAGTRSIAKMANTLLDVSRLEEGKMPITHTRSDLVEIIRASASTLGMLDPSRAITIHAPAPVMADCDRELIQRVVDNLIGNAIKHSPAGGGVRVEASVVQGRARVSVLDEGPGVPDEWRARIFEKFGTMKTRGANSQHAAGLGLAFCRLAIGAHGGTVDVAPGPAGGSVFTFEIPA
jgi:signal transduction histidine kinase